MQMVEVARDLPIKRGKRGIDQQVMMSAVGFAGARRRQVHSGDAELHGHVAAHGGAVRRLDQGDTGASRRGRSGFFDGRRIDPDANDVGHDRRIVRNVSVITQQELQSVLSCGQRDLGLGLAVAKMNVVEIARDRLIERRLSGVDEKVMMTGIRPYYSCGRDLHVLDPETDLDLGRDRRAVLEIDEEYPGFCGRRTSRGGGLLRAGLELSVHGHCNKNNQAAACKSTHGQLPRYANMGLEDQQVGAENPDRSATSEPSCSSRAIPEGPTRTDRSRPHESGLYIEIRLQLAYSAAVMRIDAAIRCFAVGLVVAFGLLAEAHAAEPRVALVIGNGAYRSVPELDNSRNDADDISEQLKRVGFAVIDGRDLDRSAMYAALGRFAQRVRGTDAGLVYYSGHGMQINGQNYLVPVDLKLAGSSFTPFDLVKLDDVIEALNYTAGVKLLVLDACRDNPFANSVADNKGSRGIGATRGLAKIERSLGMLIAYSTQSNSVAADGIGRNSPFTAALVREIQVPGLEVATVFRRVAVNVNRGDSGRADSGTVGVAASGLLSQSAGERH